MKKLIYLIVLFLLAGMSNSFAQTNESIKRPTILFVGTYHFNNPGADVVNPEADDVLSAKRQKEIQEVNALLTKFAATKIGIEQTPETAIIGERYRQYLQNKYELGRNEIYQIAFRLGRDSNLKQPYQIDSNGTFPYGAVEDFAKLNNQNNIFDESKDFFEKTNAEFNARQKTMTVRELLLFMNEPKEIDKGQAAYLRYAKIGADRLYPGVDLLTAWYQRNLRIYANISRMQAQPNDRILILIGAGHLAHLRQFARDSGEFNIVEVKDYLGK